MSKIVTLALALVVSGSAWPEETSTPATTGEKQQKEVAEESARLDDVVVTATRREQLERNVPLAITTLTGAKLAEMGALKFDEYAPTVPGLSFTNCGCTPGEKYTFRAVATDGIKSSLRPLTAMYFGDTPITYASGISTIAYTADPELLDLDRVEVIRGPQGTLFGASAIGGAIRILPNLPELGRSSGVLGASSSVTTDGGPGYGTHAIGNLPLGGHAALRGLGYYRHRRGYIDGAPIGEADLNDDATGGVRLTGLYEPDEAVSVTARFAHQNRRSDGSPVEDARTATPVRTDQYLKEPNHDEWSLANLAFEWQPHELRLTSSTSWLERDPYHTRDFTTFVQTTQGEFVPTLVRVDESARELTQEFRLQSETGGTVDWLVGLFGQDQLSRLYQDIPSPGFDAATGGKAAAAGMPDNLGLFANRTRVGSYAVFGDLSWRLGERWDLSTGARLYRIEQDHATRTNGLIQGSFGAINVAERTHESGVTPRVSLVWRALPELSLYGNVAKGFRPGGVNAVTPACEQAQSDAGFATTPGSFASDTLWSYELGAKARALGNRLYARGAVYHIDWNEIQTQRFQACGSPTITENSGAVVADGVELTLTALPLPGLELEFDGAYNDARYAEDSPANQKRKGDPVADVPDHTYALAATYGLPHPGSFVRVDYQWRGSLPNYLGNGTPDPVAGYTQLHARVSWSFGPLQATLAGRNLLNERGVLSRAAGPWSAGLPIEIRVPPRTVTLGFEYPF